MDFFTDDEVTLIQEMKEKIPSDLLISGPEDIVGDIRLLRFLRDAAKQKGVEISRQEIVDFAVGNFLGFIKWRKDFGVDEIRKIVESADWEDIPGYPILRKFLPSNLMLRGENGQLLFDKEGRPVSIERAGLLNLHGFSSELSVEEILRAHIGNMEKRSLVLDKLSRERKSIVQMSLIKDFGGFDVGYSIKNPTKTSEAIKRVRQMMEIARDFYPETVGLAILVNMPTVVVSAWSTISRLLHKQQLDLTHVVGKIDAPTVNPLVKWFGLEILPKDLGGICVSRLAALPGGLGDDRFAMGPERMKVEISRSEIKEIVVAENAHANEIMNLSVGVEDGEMMFGVKTENPENWILPLQKLSSERCIRLNLEISGNGKLFLVLNNKGSWLRGKTVHYNFHISSSTTNKQTIDIE